MPIPENPIEYLVYRLQGRWLISEDDVKTIGKSLYALQWPAPTAADLAIVASELSDDQLPLLLPELPEEVVRMLDDIPA